MSKKKTRQRKAISPDETKADRFVRVVTPRIGKAVKAIRTIGYCASNTYEYTPVQVRQMTDVLIKAVRDVQLKYETKAGVEDEFAFGE